MRKIVYMLGIITILAGLTLVSCKPSTEKEKEAEENLEEANEDFIEAKKAATAEEWEAFKVSGDSIIKKNNERIAELKLKIKRTGKAIDAEYEKSINALEQKNKDLKVKMEVYKNDTNDDWQSFKREFNHDIQEIGQALKDITVDNEN